jgi:hypothetical protein
VTRTQKINSLLAAALKEINDFADASGYGEFVSDAIRHQLAVNVTNAAVRAVPVCDDPQLTAKPSPPAISVASGGGGGAETTTATLFVPEKTL